MTLHGTYSAVVDRLEDDLAVLEVDADGDLREFVVDADSLPSPTRRADVILEIVVQNGTLTDATFDRRATRQQRQQSQTRFDRLSRRPPRDDDQE